MAFEDSASNYKGTQTLDSIFPDGKASQGAVIVHTFTGDASQLDEYYSQMNAAGLAWGFFCSADYDTATTLITENAAGAAGGDTPASPSQSSGSGTGSPTSAAGAPAATSSNSQAAEPTQSASTSDGGDGGNGDDSPSGTSSALAASATSKSGRGGRGSSGRKNRKTQAQTTDSCAKKDGTGRGQQLCARKI